MQNSPAEHFGVAQYTQLDNEKHIPSRWQDCKCDFFSFYNHATQAATCRLQANRYGKNHQPADLCCCCPSSPSWLSPPSWTPSNPVSMSSSSFCDELSTTLKSSKSSKSSTIRDRLLLRLEPAVWSRGRVFASDLEFLLPLVDLANWDSGIKQYYSLTYLLLFFNQSRALPSCKLGSPISQANYTLLFTLACKKVHFLTAIMWLRILKVEVNEF